MTKYMVLSVAIHALIFVIQLVQHKQIENGNSSEYGVDLVMTENQIGESNSRIIEMSINGNPETKEHKTYYYGIGISVDIVPSGYHINHVENGYPASFSGITLGDIITQINGSPISLENDIRSSHSKTLVLTILRNGVKFKLTIKTDKIFYE